MYISELPHLSNKREVSINVFPDLAPLLAQTPSSTFIYSKPNYRKVEMLKSWDGDRAKLGNAERFILQLTEVKK